MSANTTEGNEQGSGDQSGGNQIDLSTLQSEEELSAALISPTSNVDLDQVRQILRTKSVPRAQAEIPPEPPPPPTEQPDQPTEVPPEVEPQEGEPPAPEAESAEPKAEGEEPPPAESEPGGEVEPPKGKRARVTVGHLPPAQRKVIDLVSIKGIQIPEAQSIVVREMMDQGWAQADAERAVFGYGQTPTQGVKTEAPAEEPPQPKLTRAEQAWKNADQEIQEANVELKSATEAYDVPRIEDARTKLNDARWKQFHAQQAVNQERQEHALNAHRAFLTQANESTSRILSIYPEAATRDTPLWEAVADKISEIEQNDPNFFHALPNWPEFIVAAEAARLGIVPLKPQRTPTPRGGTPPVNGQQTAPPPPAPKRQAVKLTPAAGASSDGQPTVTTLETEEDATRYVASLVDPNDKEVTLERMRALLRSGGRVTAASG